MDKCSGRREATCTAKSVHFYIQDQQKDYFQAQEPQEKLWNRILFGMVCVKHAFLCDQRTDMLPAQSGVPCPSWSLNTWDKPNPMTWAKNGGEATTRKYRVMNAE